MKFNRRCNHEILGSEAAALAAEIRAAGLVDQLRREIEMFRFATESALAGLEEPYFFAEIGDHLLQIATHPATAKQRRWADSRIAAKLASRGRLVAVGGCHGMLRYLGEILHIAEGHESTWAGYRPGDVRAATFVEA